MTDYSSEESSFTLRVMIADDNEHLTQTFIWMLEALGYNNVKAVHDGHKAITLARSFLPEVIILDINLPGLNGHDVCRELRNDPALEKSIFVAQTGWDKPEDITRSKAAGFHHHWVKPVNIECFEELLTSLRQKSVSTAA